MNPIHSYPQLLAEIAPLRNKLTAHAVLKAVDDPLSLQLFMEGHCFAVWDFMSLLKRLQQQLTCVTVPWVPPKSTVAARLINEIVLAEETDEVAPHHYRGHFDLYVESMGEVQANGTPILELVSRLREGEDVNAILEDLPILEEVRAFVQTTLFLCKGKPHEVAAAFLLGREDLLPEVFQSLLDKLETQNNTLNCKTFRLYLKRHIELDGGSHSVMGVKILEELCDRDPKRWAEAVGAAKLALQARLELFDGLYRQIYSEKTLYA